MDAVDTVSELTRVSWNEVYEYPIVDTLAYISYHNYKARKIQKEIDDFKRRTRK